MARKYYTNDKTDPEYIPIHKRDGQMKGRKPYVPDIAAVEDLAGKGLNDKQICASLGISYETFYKSKRLNREFLEAYERGRANGIKLVASMVFKKAVEEQNLDAGKFYLKTVGKWRENDEVKQEVNIVLPALFATNDEAAKGIIDIETDVHPNIGENNGQTKEG